MRTRAKAYSRVRPKKLERGEKVRIGTLNIGSMTGRGAEVAGMMRERRVNVLCLQETKWRGTKAKVLGEGCKLFYSGGDGKRNGVGIVV